MICCSSWDLFGTLSCQSWGVPQQCGARLSIHILNYCMNKVVRDAIFLAGGVLKCNLAHRWSVAVLSMLFKIKSNPGHHLNCALPLPNVPERVTRGALVSHIGTRLRISAAELQYRITLEPVSCSVSLERPWWPCIWWCGTGGFKSRAFRSYTHLEVIIIIIYHDFLPPPRRGSHVKSDNTHTIIQHTPLSPYTWHLRLDFQ